MIYVNVFIMLLYGMLAILSRKHYSKYKGVGKIPFAMADYIFCLLGKRFDTDRAGRLIRKLQVVSPHEVHNIAGRIVKKNIAVCILVLFTVNLISLFLGIAGIRVADAGNVIYRDDYSGQTREYDISLTYEGDETRVNLSVMPVEYSPEQFYEKSEQLFLEFEEALKGDNEDLLHIRDNINIPEYTDRDFDIIWYSDSPHILSSTGQVNFENIYQKTYVTLTATIEYGELSAVHEYRLGIEADSEPTSFELAENALNDLEEQNRNMKEIYIPENLSGVEISLVKEKDNSSVQIFLLGIAICILTALRGVAALKQSVKDRNRMLMDLYPWFVNSLWLLLGAGLTVRSGIKQLIAESESRNPLVLELEYAVNQIDSGMDEAKVYEDLGNRLELRVYSGLMHQLSRNLRIGTKDLLGLMEDELAVSMEIRKENAKRKGEEASTKLLFPMIVLLLVVMLMIIVPVMVSL